MAHYHRPARRHRGLRDCRQHAEYRRPLSCVFYIPDWRVLRQLGHHRLGLVDSQPDEGEEGSRSRHDECGGSGMFSQRIDEMEMFLTGI